jgi:acetylornithine/succinyldiaminopimelate/putrescine aminotransferase
MEVIKSIKQNNSQSGVISPIGTVTPDFIGQTYIDTVAGIAYTSTGLTNADWISGGGSTTSNAEHRARYLISQTMLKY